MLIFLIIYLSHIASTKNSWSVVPLFTRRNVGTVWLEVFVENVFPEIQTLCVVYIVKGTVSLKVTVSSILCKNNFITI